jgi:hypothetical protein
MFPYFGTQNVPPQENLTQLFDNSGPNNAPLYAGWAQAGTANTGLPPTSPATSAAIWYIVQYTYDGNNMVSAIRSALNNGNVAWTNRASLTYL